MFTFVKGECNITITPSCAPRRSDNEDAQEGKDTMVHTYSRTSKIDLLHLINGISTEKGCEVIGVSKN